MAEYINNELAHDTYKDDMSLGPLMADDAAATITISKNPALMQFLVGKGGNVHWTDEREWNAPAGADVINSFKVTNIRGVRFRNAIAGQRAQIICTLASATDQDPIFESGLLSPGSIAASGSATGGSGGVIVGEIKEMAGGNPDPAKFLACDGVAYLKADYGAGAAGTLDGYLAAAGYPYGSDALHFNVPDKRERVAVGAGPNTALGATEGVAVANRHATRHRTSLTDPGHSHGLPAGGGPVTNPPGTTWPTDITNYAPTSAPAATGITVGSGVVTDPLDGPAFVATAFYIAYAS